MIKKLKIRSTLAFVLIFTLVIGLSISTQPVTAASDPYAVPEYVLRVGASTNDSSKVRLAQQALNAVCNERLTTDGGYGSSMQAAVKRYQSSRRLTSDGKVGRTTWDYLIGEYLAYQQLRMSTNYRIMQCGTTDRCLDIPMESQYSDGTRVQLWTVANNKKNQLFYLTRNSDGSYKINVRVSGKVLEVRNSSMSNGGQVAQWKYESGYKCKHWYIVYDRTKQAYEIINQNSGLALDLTGNNLVKSAKYQQYSRNNTLAQRFTFQLASSGSGATTTTPAKPTTPSATTGYYKVSHSKGVNLRSSNSTSGALLTSIPYKAVIYVSQVSGNWGKTTYSGKTGWVCLDYCKKTTAPSPSVPSTTSKIPADIRVSQMNSRSCTSAAVTILLRAKYYVKGNDYKTVTESKVRNAGWTSGGLKNNFSFGGYKVKSVHISGSTSKKEATIKKLLGQHPEGLVIYGWNSSRSHAVYLNSDFMVLDPAANARKTYISVGTSFLPGKSISSVQKIWYIN